MLPILAGSFLTGIGLISILKWDIFESVSIINLNSALCLLMAGFALLIPNIYPRIQAYGRGLIGISIISICLIQLFQISEINKMPINTLTAFLLVGLIFNLLPFIQKKYVSITAQLLNFLVLTIGISSILGYMLNLEFLYGWHRNQIMPFIVSIALSVLGMGLWSLLIEPIHSEILDDKKNKKILILNRIIVVCIISFVVITVFSIMYLRSTISPTLISNGYNQEQFLIRILLALTIGIFLLYWQFLPLLRNIYQSFNKLIAANERLEESENRFRSAFDYAAVGMALVSSQGQCIRVNNSLCKILGYSEIELLNMNFENIIHSEDSKKNLPYIRKMLEGKLDAHQSEQRYIHKNGELIWILVSLSVIRDPENKPLYFISQLQNITKEKNAAEQLEQLAYFDSLTGLANRNKLEQYINALLVSARRRPQGFAIIYLDLDHFKNINDTLGHDAGDVLLQVVADRLKSAVRKNDLVGRLGGDEFVLVITDVEKLEAIAHVAQKLLSNLLSPITIRSHEIYVTTSIGISFYPYDGQDLQTLMKNADLALYRAKERGRNNYQFCTPEMTARAHEKMMRQNALAHALIKNEFQLYYLPIIDLVHNQITGVEALLRWQSPEYGMVTPEEIISLADETGFIIPLGEWILKTACKQVKSWQLSQKNSLTLSVNLSARQFKQANFVEEVLQILKTMKFSPDHLELEITESLIMQDPENTQRILAALKKSGIRIAIDDFGTGYSSLSYLKHFDIDKIKIDKTFIRQMTTDDTSSAIVMAMIVMSNKLGIKAMAEGVETQDQYEYLIREQCTEMQGYYVSQPLTVNDMTQFLQNPETKLNILQKIKDQIIRTASSRSSA